MTIRAPAVVATFVCLAGFAVAQVRVEPHVFGTVYTAADGTRIDSIGLNGGRPSSASGTSKSKHHYSVSFSYEPAGITYTFSADGSANSLKVSVLQGVQAISISAKDSSTTAQWLIFQQLIANTHNTNDDLLVYEYNSYVRKPTISKPIREGAAVYSYIGKSLKGLFPNYKTEVNYFLPVLDAIAAGAPEVNGNNHGYTIDTRLNVGLPTPRVAVCPEAGPKLSPLSVLVCIGSGIETGQQSAEPDALLAQSEAQSISALPARAGRNPRHPLPIERTP
jgi:hypothetical protein